MTALASYLRCRIATSTLWAWLRKQAEKPAPEFIHDNCRSTFRPRASAAGERLWSDPTQTTSADAAWPRLHEFRCRMLRRGYPVEPPNLPSYCLQPWDPGYDFDDNPTSTNTPGATSTPNTPTTPGAAAPIVLSVLSTAAAVFLSVAIALCQTSAWSIWFKILVAFLWSTM